jgi:thiamine biosynthesis lipoprotein
MSAPYLRRARPLLGTLVTIGLLTEKQNLAHQACESAFEVIETIQTLMSAHQASSDLAKISNAQAGETIQVHPWTHEVIGLAQYWFQQSGGAFDPCMAARQLKRPGLTPHAQGSLHDLNLLPHHAVEIKRPVMLDFGGIAKGYAVDKAVQLLQALGMTDGMLDAGGDMRAWGQGHSVCEIRHAQLKLRDRRLKKHLRLHNQSIATSVSAPLNSEFVQTAARRRTWRSATVLAPDCVTADALTKWALQSSLLCPDLGKILRQHKAKMWRSE